MQLAPRAGRELRRSAAENDWRTLLCLSFDDPRAPFGLSHEPVEVARPRGRHLNLDALASIVEEIGGGNASTLLANVTPRRRRRRRRRAAVPEPPPTCA